MWLDLHYYLIIGTRKKYFRVPLIKDNLLKSSTYSREMTTEYEIMTLNYLCIFSVIFENNIVDWLMRSGLRNHN